MRPRLLRPSASTLLPLLLAAGLAAAIPPAADDGDRPVDAARRAGVLLFGNGAEPGSLDPHLATGVTENNIISALLEGLVNYHLTDDYEPEPGVAESWEHSADHRVWTFRLRADARWSNGDPVRASDFVFSARRILTPSLAGQYANTLYVIDQAEAYHRGEIEDFGRVGVEALDDHTLRYRLVGPVPYFLSMLNHYAWYPVHPPTIERHGGMDARFTEWTRPGNFVGNGPFVLTAWDVNRVLRVERSPTYWDHAAVRLQAIEFHPIENDATEESMFLNGQLHITNIVPTDRIPVLRREKPDLIRLDPYLGTYFYRFNTTRPPLDDVRVRRALALAIDQQALVDHVTQGDQRPAAGFVPDGMEGYESPFSFAPDPAEARRLLAAAGFPGGRGFPRLELLVNTSEGHRRIAEAVQAMWKAELGIDIGILNQEWKVYLDSQRTLAYDISRSGWIGDYMDPITMLGIWVTDDGNNNTGWSNAEYDRLLAASFREGDAARRFALLREAEDILLEEMPVAPLYWYTRIYLLDPRVDGWHPKLLDNRPWKYIGFRP